MEEPSVLVVVLDVSPWAWSRGLQDRQEAAADVSHNLRSADVSRSRGADVSHNLPADVSRLSEEFTRAADHVLVFAAAFLALHRSNRIAVIAAHAAFR